MGRIGAASPKNPPKAIRPLSTVRLFYALCMRLTISSNPPELKDRLYKLTFIARIAVTLFKYYIHFIHLHSR